MLGRQMASTKKRSLLFASLFLISAISGQDGVIAGKATTVESITVNWNGSANLTCHLREKNLTNYNWKKLKGGNNTERLKNLIRDQKIDEKRGTLILENVIPEDHGTYECTADEGNQIFTSKTIINITVNGVPIIRDCIATPLMVGLVHLKWKVCDYNNPVIKYLFVYEKSGSHQWSRLDSIVANGRSSHFLNITNFEKGETYELQIRTSNKMGEVIGNCTKSFKTLEQDFIPRLSVNESTNASIKIDWTLPAADLREYYQYKILWTPVNNKSASTHSNITSNYLTIRNLEPNTKYSFKVRACLIKIARCGNWSTEQEGCTMKNESNISADLRPSGIINLSAAIIAFTLYFF